MIVIPVTDTRIKPLLCAKPFILCNLLESSEESKKSRLCYCPYFIVFIFFILQVCIEPLLLFYTNWGSERFESLAEFVGPSR